VFVLVLSRMEMLNQMLLENGVNSCFEKQLDLVAYDTKLFNRWSLLGTLFYKDLYEYILVFAFELERKGFWNEIHSIFESTKMSKCWIYKEKWDVKKELQCLLCVANPKWVAVCSTNCCFSFERKFCFMRNECTLSVTDVRKTWNIAFGETNFDAGTELYECYN